MGSYSDLSSVDSSTYFSIPSSSQSSSSKTRPLWALLCVGLALVGWLLQAFLVQEENSYSQELFILYIRNVTGYSPYLIVGLLWQKRQTDNEAYYNTRGWSFWLRRIKIVCPFSLIAFGAGYTWYLSLQHTTISLNTTIYNANVAVVFVLSVFLLKEHVSLPKIIAVLFCGGGVVLEAFAPTSSDDQGESDVIGVLIVLLSMFLFSVYEVVFKKFEEGGHEDNSINTNSVQPQNPSTVNASDALIILSLIGLWNCILVPILVIIWNFAGWETFEWPPSAAVWGQIIANGALDGMYNCALLVGITVSSPLFMSMGCLLSIPISIFIDVLRKQFIVSGFSIGGSLCIVIGFVLLSLSQQFSTPDVLDTKS